MAVKVDTATDNAAGRRWRVPVTIGVGAWAMLLVVARLWAGQVPSRLPLGNVSPFIGSLRVLPLARWLLPLTVAAVLVTLLPVLATRMRWRPLLFASWLAAGAWAASLAATQGSAGLIDPLASVHEYVYTLPALDAGVGEFLRTFVERLPTYPTHTRGHPPGPVLVLYVLQQLGLPVLAAEAALVIVAGSSAVPAVAVTVRIVAVGHGTTIARAALPFLVLAPMALWIATSMDALFLAVSAWGVALLALATEAGHRWAHVWAGTAGVILGGGLYLTYGLAPFGVLPLAVIAAARRWRLLVPSALGVGFVVVAFTAAGFWWPAGVAATHAEWASGIGPIRPYGYFLVANIAILGFLIGPAGAAGIAALRDRRLWWIVASTLIALAVSDLGGLERGEVERIWLPFAIWLLPATVALPGRARGWLAVQAGLAIAFQGLISSPW